MPADPQQLMVGQLIFQCCHLSGTPPLCWRVLLGCWYTRQRTPLLSWICSYCPNGGQLLCYPGDRLKLWSYERKRGSRLEFRRIDHAAVFRPRICKSLRQCSGSMTFWGGSGSGSAIRIHGSTPLTNGSDPAIFVIDLQDASKKLIF